MGSIDCVSTLIKTNYFQVLEEIFLYLNSDELKLAQTVSTSWRNYLKHQFWKSTKIRKILGKRLDDNWENEKFKRVEMRLMEHPCVNNCELNHYYILGNLL